MAIPRQPSPTAARATCGSHPLGLAAELKTPVLGLYGGADTGIPNEIVQKMQKTLKDAGKPGKIVLYPDTPHGFHADYRPSYRQYKAEEGWKAARGLAEGEGSGGFVCGTS